MSKRTGEDILIKRYHKKIKKLEEQKEMSARRRRTKIIYSDSDSENEGIETTNNADSPMAVTDDNVVADISLATIENHAEITDDVGVPQDTPIVNTEPMVPQIPKETISELDPEIRLALGDPTEDTPVFGENIHPDIAQRWQPILRKGLTKEVKDKMSKEHNIPDNCRLLKAPSLNPEIAAAVADVVRARDKKMELKQAQLGLGITAISKAMTTLISDGKKVDAIKLLSEGCRVLCDLHYVETQTRTKLITPCLDKSFTNIMQDEERDDTLFGNKLSEKIKAAKSIEKQGLQKKRNAPTLTKSAPQQANRGKQSGNWSNPPRYPSSANRGGGGRGGMYPVNRPMPSTSYPNYRRTQSQATYTAPSQPPPPPPAGLQTRQQSARARAPMRH